MVFWPENENLTSAKYDFNGKSISRGAEWHKFQLHSTSSEEYCYECTLHPAAIVKHFPPSQLALCLQAALNTKGQASHTPIDRVPSAGNGRECALLLIAVCILIIVYN